MRVIETSKGQIRMGFLSDGTIVKLRPGNDGGLNRQTIEIINAKGRTVQEVRYGNKI